MQDDEWPHHRVEVKREPLFDGVEGGAGLLQLAAGFS